MAGRHWYEPSVKSKKLALLALTYNPGYDPYPRPSHLGESGVKDIEHQLLGRRKALGKVAKKLLLKNPVPTPVANNLRWNPNVQLHQFSLSGRTDPTPRHGLTRKTLSDLGSGSRWRKRRRRPARARTRRLRKGRKGPRRSVRDTKKKKSLTASMKQLRDWLGPTEFGKLKVR